MFPFQVLTMTMSKNKIQNQSFTLSRFSLATFFFDGMRENILHIPQALVCSQKAIVKIKFLTHQVDMTNVIQQRKYQILSIKFLLELNIYFINMDTTMNNDFGFK